MDLIKMYCSDADIKPKVLLGHFLRFLGFYIESITNEKNIREEVESLIDIYIIGDEFTEQNDGLLDYMENEKTILILKDGWTFVDEHVRSIRYDGLSEQNFLLELVQHISDIIYHQDKEYECLFQNLKQWELLANWVARNYSRNQLLKAQLFTRCFLEQDEYYYSAMNSYKNFIDSIEVFQRHLYDFDYWEYVLLYAKYEVNLICKKNNFVQKYDNNDLLNQCELLLEMYEENEELHLLKADILYELLEENVDACNTYTNLEISHCAYAKLKSGKIFKDYLEDYMSAILVFKSAINEQKNYFQVWYQLGDTYEKIGEYKKAVYAFNSILQILNEKYKKRILAPLELEYLYKATMRIAIIYKLYLMDYQTAEQYNRMAIYIKEKSPIEEYVKLMWEDDEEYESIILKINEAIEEHVNIKLEEIY